MKKIGYSIFIIFTSFLLLTTVISVQPACAGLLYTIEANADHLVSIDTDTLTFTDIGALGVAFNYGGLAYDPNLDILYMIDGRSMNSLYTVDRATGAATLIGTHGITDMFGLGFDSTNNTLYAGTRFNSNNLYTLDVGTGSSTLIGSSSPATLDGLAYNSKTDTLIDLAAGTGDIYSIDRSTGAPTLLYDGPWTNNSGFAYDVEKDLYWAVDVSGFLYSYDPNNGYARTTILSNLAGHDGLAYLSQSAVPEPTTMLLLGSGLIGLAAFRRKFTKR